MVTLDTGQFDRALRRVNADMRASAITNQRQSQATGAAIGGSMAAGVKKLGVAAGLGGVALAGLAVAGGAAGLKTAAGLETARIGFTTMLGSAQKADVFLRKLQDFAARTPFEFPELQTAASSLISVGIAADDVIPIMTSLGNATAGMGTGSEGIKRATVALQQMTAAGRITAQDLNQLRDAGVPVFELLAASTHKTTTEVAAMAAAGKLGKHELDQLMAGLKSGAGLERFNGLMQKTSLSLTGLASTFKDTLGMGLAKAIEPSLPMLKVGLTGAIKAVGDAMPAVSQGFSAISAVLSHLAPAAAGVGGILLHVVLPAVSGVAHVLGSTFLGSTAGATAAIIGLGIAFGASKFSGPLQAVSQRLIRVATDVDTLGKNATRTRATVGNLGLGLGKVASVLGGPWGIAIGLGVSALITMATKQSEADKATREFTKSLTFQNGALDENSRLTLAKQLADEGTLAAALKAGVSERNYTTALTEGGAARQGMIDELDRIAGAHSNARQSGRAFVGNTDEVSLAAMKAAAQLRTMGGSLDAQSTSATQAANATGPVATETDKVTTAVEKAGTASAGTTTMEHRLWQKHHDLAAATQLLIDKFTILRDGALNVEQAEVAWQAALDGVSASAKANGKSLSTHTAKGRANRAAIVGMITALNDKVTADVHAGKSTQHVTKRMTDGEVAIRKAAKAAGFNKTQVDHMIASMVKTPKQVKTEITTPGMGKALDNVAALRKRIREAKDKHIAIVVEYHSTGRVSIGGGSKVVARADGGPITGIGGPRQDNIAGIDRRTGQQTAWVSNKEFVVNAPAYAKNRRAVEAINRGAVVDPQGLADGGTVSRQFVVNTSRRGSARPDLTLADAVKAARKEGTKDALAAGRKFAKAALAAGLIGGHIDISHPRGLTRWRGGTFTNLFAAAMRMAEQDAGRRFRVLQGGFRPTTSYSGSTHNKDAVDAHVDYTLLRAFRRRVGAMGDRTGLGHWGPHMHGVPAPGRGYGSPSAQAQYRDYLRRGGARQGMRSPWGLSTGTDAAPPGFNWTAEKGAELVVNPQLRRYQGKEAVLNHGQTRSALGGSGSGPTIINQFPTADPRVASAVADRVVTQLASRRIGG
jgi:tape measure domain-containing protein